MNDRAPVAAGQEPIQPCGFLLGLSDEWIVQHASANAASFLEVDATALIGEQATDHIGVEAIHDLRNRLALLRNADAVERIFRCPLHGDARLFDLSIHRSGDTVVLEGQPSVGKSYGDVTATVSGMVSRLDGARDLRALLDAGARQIRALTGFDRVSIVRLAEDESAVVAAECTRATLASAIGKPFAAEPDAPVRYGRCRLHVIDDVQAAPVAVHCDRALAGAPLDLTLAMLRSGSDGRIAALRGNDVGATMTLSLIVDGRLWGLIDCQHHFARSPGFERRSMADLFAQMFAMRIEILELKTARAG